MQAASYLPNQVMNAQADCRAICGTRPEVTAPTCIFYPRDIGRYHANKICARSVTYNPNNPESALFYSILDFVQFLR